MKYLRDVLSNSYLMSQSYFTPLHCMQVHEQISYPQKVIYKGITTDIGKNRLENCAPYIRAIIEICDHL